LNFRIEQLFCFCAFCCYWSIARSLHGERLELASRRCRKLQCTNCHPALGIQCTNCHPALGIALGVTSSMTCFLVDSTFWMFRLWTRSCIVSCSCSIITQLYWIVHYKLYFERSCAVHVAKSWICRESLLLKTYMSL